LALINENKEIRNLLIEQNIKQLRNWEVENPEFSNVDSKKNDEYMVISQNSLGELNDKKDVKYQNTIIKNVLKTAKLSTEESLVSANQIVGSEGVGGPP
jgi:hypothetical protein